MNRHTIRPARETDASVIKQLIRSVGINPMDLDWRRFTVAVDEQDQVIATGQIKPHNKGEVLELASIAVVEEHRGEGLARAIIEHLLKDGPRPLYLTCRSRLQPFYQKFGFQTISYDEMPRFYQRISRLAGIFITITRQDRADGLSVMKLQ
jgi:N-acetylglutamate synthase-like GNAT family acetyltransferase